MARAPRSSGPAANRRPDPPPVTGDARVDALIRRLSAPATAAELGDEPRIRALFQATYGAARTAPAQRQGDPRRSSAPAAPLRSRLSPVLDTAAVAVTVVLSAVGRR